MTDTEYEICETQGNIYRYAAFDGYKIDGFSDLFLDSVFCARSYDTVYSHYQFAQAEESFEEAWKEIGNQLKKYEEDLMFDPDIAYWIGFTYRQLWCETTLSSRELRTRVPFEDLAYMYIGYHTLSTEMSGERLIETFKLPKKKEAEQQWKNRT